MPDMKSLSPAELVLACRRNDAAAWDELVARYERLVYTIPLRYGLPQSEAEDVFQSVWLALVRHLPALQQPHRVGAWLVTTARRECWERRRGAAYQREADAEPETLARGHWIEAGTPDEVVMQYEVQRGVRAAVERLDVLCRRLLTLLYFDAREPSYAEVAAELNVPEGSIGPTRARCLQKARRLME
jgi:RNA polymerase sigma factor (sigma-70 family)